METKRVRAESGVAVLEKVSPTLPVWAANILDSYEFCKAAGAMKAEIIITEEDNQQQQGRAFDRSGGGYYDRAINGRR